MNSYFDKSKATEGHIQTMPVVTEETKNIPSLIRTPETGDKVFLVKDGVAHWIMNPQAFEAVNGQWDKVVAINRNKFKLLQMGERITKDNADTYQLPKDEVVKNENKVVKKLSTEEFKTYDTSVQLERIKGKTSTVIVVYPTQYEYLSSLYLDKMRTLKEEIILVVNGEKVLAENNPLFSFADKVIVLKDQLGLPEAMLKGCNVSEGEWIIRVDLLRSI